MHEVLCTSLWNLHCWRELLESSSNLSLDYAVEFWNIMRFRHTRAPRTDAPCTSPFRPRALITVLALRTAMRAVLWTSLESA